MIEVLGEGLNALTEYFVLRRIISLLIAFALSGAIANFMSQGAVLKYFGPKAKRTTSYLVASVSGAILAVCSCSVLPMFASIRKKGAGIGPAVAFLFSGPAINILAVTLTFSLISVSIGIFRVLFAVILALVIGFIMFLLWRKSEVVSGDQTLFEDDTVNKQKTWQSLLFFLTLIGILLTNFRPDAYGDTARMMLTVLQIILVLGLIVQMVLFFTKEDLLGWGRETFNLARKIIPLFIIGIFIVGIIGAVLSPELMVTLVGQNTYPSNLLASLFGALMYFATLTEVAAVNTFISLGMHQGPALTLLLAGPSLSLPNMIVITRVLGIKKGLSYFLLVIILSAMAGLITGLIIG